MIQFDNGGLCQYVVGVGEQMEGLNHERAGCRGIQPESLVANNTHIGQLQGEIIGNGRYHAFAAYQDSYLLRCNSLVHQHPDGIFQFHQYLLLIVIARQEADADQTL